jgi:hypothetical protein
MDIDAKLTTIENLERLLEAGAVVILRKRGDAVDVATGTPEDKHGSDDTPLGQMIFEGLDFDFQWAIESATGNTLADAVRDVATLNNLPY